MGGDRTIAEAQLLLPFSGSQEKVLFGIVEGNFVNQTSGWLLGLGLGYRKVSDDKIFGGYCLANYHNTEAENGFFVLNPGFEVMGELWNINLNGYFPLSNHQNVGEEDWASNFGVYDYVEPIGHLMW